MEGYFEIVTKIIAIGTISLFTGGIIKGVLGFLKLKLKKKITFTPSGEDQFI